MIVGAGANITVQTGDEGYWWSIRVGDVNDKVSLVRQLSVNHRYRQYQRASGSYRRKCGLQGSASGAARRSRWAVAEGWTREAGGGRGGVPIVAHENVLARMATAPGWTVVSHPTDAWPTQTFHIWHEDLYFNGESIQVLSLRARRTAIPWCTSGAPMSSVPAIFF
jgi:hypothetical protein